jgi:signal peptidase I
VNQEPKKPRSKRFGTVETGVFELRPKRWRFRFSVFMGILVIALIVVCRAFLFQTFKIPSGSMFPTLKIGDHIIVNKFIYGISVPGIEGRRWRYRLPQKGDVVVFYRFSEFEDIDSNTHYIKRIVAVPGDVVEVREFRTYVNGVGIGKDDDVFVGPESDLGSTSGRSYGPVELQGGEYFVLGDNHANSRDSRFYGPIHLSDIEGQAEMIYWSWKMEGGSTTVRWGRVGQLIR